MNFSLYPLGDIDSDAYNQACFLAKHIDEWPHCVLEPFGIIRLSCLIIQDILIQAISQNAVIKQHH